MKKKHYREFFNKEYMYGFIGENRDNLKKYRCMTTRSVFNNLYYILEFELVNEKVKLKRWKK